MHSKPTGMRSSSAPAVRTSCFSGSTGSGTGATTICPPAGTKGAELAIVTARRNGSLVMVWPLVLERSNGLSTLSWMGDPVSQYGDVLVDDLADATDVLRQGLEFHIGQHPLGYHAFPQGPRRCRRCSPPRLAGRGGDRNARGPVSRPRQLQRLGYIRAALLRRLAPKSQAFVPPPRRKRRRRPSRRSPAARRRAS